MSWREATADALDHPRNYKEERMPSLRARPPRYAALIAMAAMLLMLVGATDAFAGGRDHGQGAGHQDWASQEQGSGDQWSDEGQSSDEWQSNEAQGGSEDCHKGENEQSGNEQTGQPQGPPQGGQPVGGQPTEQGGKAPEQEKKEHGEKGGYGEQQKKQKEQQESQKGQSPSPIEVTTPVAQTTPAQQAPVSTQQAPTQAQQAPTQAEQAPSGQVQGEQLAETRAGNRETAQVAPTETAQAAETSQGGGLASTGFDVWKVALLGALCVAGAALMLRRTRRT
jgi:hypothetical protein